MSNRLQDIREGICPLCGHDEILEAESREGIERHSSRPRAVAYRLDMLWGRHKEYGLLRTYTCRACGFTQWFALEPSQIPIGDEYKTRLIKGPARESPYR